MASILQCPSSALAAPATLLRRRSLAHCRRVVSSITGNPAVAAHGVARVQLFQCLGKWTRVTDYGNRASKRNSASPPRSSDSAGKFVSFATASKGAYSAIERMIR